MSVPTVDTRTYELARVHHEVHEFVRVRDAEQVPRRILALGIGSEVMLVGQALGRDTQRLSGYPYTFPDQRLSRAGKVLDSFLGKFGYAIDPFADGKARKYAYHADLVPWFPGRDASGKGDTVPTSEEINACWQWLERELEIVSPNIVVALGRHAQFSFVALLKHARIEVESKTYGPLEARAYDQHPGAGYKTDGGAPSVRCLPVSGLSERVRVGG